MSEGGVGPASAELEVNQAEANESHKIRNDRIKAFRDHFKSRTVVDINEARAFIDQLNEFDQKEVEDYKTKVTTDPPRNEEKTDQLSSEEELLVGVKNIVESKKVFNFCQQLLRSGNNLARDFLNFKDRPENALLLVSMALGSLNLVVQTPLNELITNANISIDVANKLSLILGVGSMGMARGDSNGGKVVGMVGGMAAAAGFTELADQITQTGLHPAVQAGINYSDETLGAGVQIVSRLKSQKRQ